MPVVTLVGVPDNESKTFVRSDLVASVVDISGSNRNKANAKIVLTTGQSFEVLEVAEDVFDALADDFEPEFIEQEPEVSAEEKAEQFEKDRQASLTLPSREVARP
jgi:hypothetical protein